jgi:Fe-S-cluster-containing hydrogenase component 2
MTAKFLWVDPKKCNGCMECEIACAWVKTGGKDTTRSRIRVIDWNQKGFFLPVSCQQCESAPCMDVCPKEAIQRDPADQRVVIDYNRCVSCRMCVAVCPFGAMGFDDQIRMVVKCDLCGGDPACVPRCEPGALVFSDSCQTHTHRIRAAASRVIDRRKKETLSR